MKKIIFLCLFVLMCSSVLGAYDDSGTWFPQGNHPSLKINFQSGTAEHIQGAVSSVTNNMANQVYILDYDNDGFKEFAIIGASNMYLYRIGSDLSIDLLDSFATGRSTPISTEFSYFNGTGEKLFVVHSPLTANSSDYYQDVYSFSGGEISRVKAQSLSGIIVTSQAGCYNDFTGDGFPECYFNGYTNGNTSARFLYAFQYNATTPTSWTQRINHTAVTVTNPPSFIDANSDGDIEVLMYGDSGVIVANSTSQMLYINTVVAGGGKVTAMWYNRDVGDYEIVVQSRVAGFVNGSGGYFGGFRVSLYALDGSTVWFTPQYQNCPNTHDGTSSTGGCEVSVSSSAQSLAYSNINNGRIYVYGFCTYAGATYSGSKICTYDKDGNLFSTNWVSTNPYSATRRISWADMIEGSNLEAVMPSGVIGLDGVIKYKPYTLPSSSMTGFCEPVDLDEDSSLDLLCSVSGFNTTILSVTGSGGGLENTQPTIYSATLDRYAVKTNEPISVTINADDMEDDSIYYGIDCDYNGAESSPFAVPLLNKFSCQYLYNGTKQIMLYVNDIAHGGSSVDLSEWANVSVSVLVGDTNQITPCFSPFMLCDNFNYFMPLVLNNWYVTSLSVLGLDMSVIPSGNSVKVYDDDVYTLAKFYNNHKYGIITATFNASLNTGGNDVFEFVIANSEHPSDADETQVLIRFTQNKIYSIFLESGNSSVNQIGTYSDNTLNNYKIQVFYDEYNNFGTANSTKIRNTYDVYKSGVLLAKGLEFYHGSTPDINRPNVTDDFESYSDYISFSSDWTNLTLDDVFVYKGTDTNVDTLVLLDNPQVVEEWSSINEYNGCILIKGDPNLVGHFDCNYKGMDCQSCCGYVEGEFQVVDSLCAVGKSGRQYANSFQKWVFKNIWLFMVLVFVGVIGFMVTRPRRRN